MIVSLKLDSFFNLKHLGCIGNKKGSVSLHSLYQLSSRFGSVNLTGSNTFNV